MTEATVTLDWRDLLRKSEERLEPAWLRKLRRGALDLFEKQSWPDRTDENWRFTDYRRLLPASLGGKVSGTSTGAEQVAELEEVLRQGKVISLAETRAEEAGPVRVSSLLDAARRQDELVKRMLEEDLAHAVDRFDTLALANFEGGLVVQVKDEGSPEDVLTLRYRPRPAEDEFHSTYSYISLGAGSRGLLVVDFGPGSANGAPSFGSDHLRIEIGDGAEWQIVFLQRLGRADNRLQRVRFSLGNGVRLRTFRFDWGGATVKAEANLILKGEGSELLWRGAYLLGGEQRFELDTLQDHVVGGDVSDLLVKGVLGQQARAIYRGLIWIHPGAQRSNAYQANRNLLLSEDAHVHSIPMLEIEANDVRCSHGSASGPIDPDQVFYLQSRGLPEREARRMIIKGFVEELFEEGVPEKFREPLERVVDRRVDALIQN